MWSREIETGGDLTDGTCVMNKTCVVTVRDPGNVVTVADFWMIDDESAEVEDDEADGEIDNQDDDDKAGAVAVLQKVGLNGTENGMEDDGDGGADN